MNPTQLILAIVALCISSTSSAPLEKPYWGERRGLETTEELINYLRKFGHWRGGSDIKGNRTDEEFRRSLRAFQSFTGLKATGEIDDDTKELMATPRCGVPDNNEAPGRLKRYVATRYKWPMNSLTYLIHNYTPDLPMNVTKSIIIQAFKFWSDVTPLTFTESTTNQANIEIFFFSGEHGDGRVNTFDGKGGVLAHAYYPTGGYTIPIHFDEDETWIDGTGSDTNLLMVATHEIGHTLGLSHSKMLSAVMHAYSNTYSKDFALDADDIEGIQSIYGKPLPTTLPHETIPSSPPAERTTSTPPPSRSTTGTPIPEYRSTTGSVPSCREENIMTLPNAEKFINSTNPQDNRNLLPGNNKNWTSVPEAWIFVAPPPDKKLMRIEVSKVTGAESVIFTVRPQNGPISTVEVDASKRPVVAEFPNAPAVKEIDIKFVTKNDTYEEVTAESLSVYVCGNKKEI